MVQLSDLLPDLSSLKHLHIHGQDLRVRLLASNLLGGVSSMTSDRLDQLTVQADTGILVPLPQTDAGLLALRAARLRRGLPGLVSLTITSSPDLTTAALIAYLSSTSLEERPAFTNGLPDVPLDHAHCGFALCALTLINCTKTGAFDSLLLPALQRFCPNLASLTLKKVDHFFEAPPASSSNAGSSLPLLPQLSQLTLSTDTRLDTRCFDAFRLPQSALRELTLVSCRYISAEHLASFIRINKLVISGCPAILDIPTALMPELREISWLGTGISVSSACHLFRHGQVRRVSLDAAAAASGWDGRAGPASTSAPARLTAPSSYSETDDLPVALLPFRMSSLLASDLPSWALIYVLAHGPPSLESFALHGTVAPAAPARPGQEGSLIPNKWRYLYFEDEDLKRMNTPWGLPRALCRVRASEETRLGWGAWLASWVVPARESKEGAGSGSTTRRLRRRPPMSLPLRYLMPSVSHTLWPDSSDFASIGNSEHQPQPRTKRAYSQPRCFPNVPQHTLSYEGASSAEMGRTASEPAREGSQQVSPVDPDGTVLEAERLACLLALPGKLHVPPSAVHESPFSLRQHPEHPAHKRVSEEQMQWLRQQGKGSILRLDI